MFFFLLQWFNIWILKVCIVCFILRLELLNRWCICTYYIKDNYFLTLLSLHPCVDSLNPSIQTDSNWLCHKKGKYWWSLNWLDTNGHFITWSSSDEDALNTIYTAAVLPIYKRLSDNGSSINFHYVGPYSGSEFWALWDSFSWHLLVDIILNQKKTVVSCYQ